ncbi:MAG TPA: signal peptidase II [Dongiaceae bacterium]|jgi:signal peptidase II|nr:signal peptidase II [Dongiaceae bacterium]
MSRRNANITALLVALGVITLDQLSKGWIRQWIDSGEHVLTPFFSVVGAWNHGVAFSIFREGGRHGPLLLVALSLVICAFLIRWLQTMQNGPGVLGIGLVVGGALGNVADRLRFGAVFDFLDVHYGDYHWPAFNLADSAISIGIFCLILDGLFYERKSAKKSSF